MALDIYFRDEIGNAIRCAMIARYGTGTPNDSEFMNALDAVGASFGLERVQDRHGGWWWIKIEDVGLLAGK